MFPLATLVSGQKTNREAGSDDYLLMLISSPTVSHYLRQKSVNSFRDLFIWSYKIRREHIHWNSDLIMEENLRLNSTISSYKCRLTYVWECFYYTIICCCYKKWMKWVISWLEMRLMWAKTYRSFYRMINVLELGNISVYISLLIYLVYIFY